MAIVHADRVKETTTNTGTDVQLELDGAVANFQSFVSGVGENSCYYLIVHRTANEWEVGLGTISDDTPDTLDRETILDSSNAGAIVNFSAGTKDVHCITPATFLYQPKASNIVLNPTFAVVLPGTHTSAIQQNNVASTTQNHECPGWRSVTGTGSPDITVSRDTSVVMRTGDKSSLKIVTTTLGTSVNRVECPLIEGEAPAIDSMLYAARNQTLTVTADVKQSAGTASASRIGIITDGTGGTTTYSSYHGANTDIERLLASVLIPSDATYIKIAIFVESATPDINVGNWMAVPAGAALTALPFAPRPPINIYGYYRGSGVNELIDTAPTAGSTWYTTTDGEASTDPDINALRPAFANDILIGGEIVGTTGTDFGVFQISGEAAGSLFAYCGASPTNGQINTFQMPIGQDGQINWKVSANTVDIYCVFPRFVGVGI